MTFNITCGLKATNLSIKSLTRQQVLTQTGIKIQFTWSAERNDPLFLSSPGTLLIVIPELVEDEEDFVYLRTACKRGSFTWSYWVNIDVSLKGEKAFSIDLPFPPFKVTNTPDLSVYRAWTHSEVRRTFLVPQLAQSVHLLPPGRAEDF